MITPARIIAANSTYELTAHQLSDDEYGQVTVTRIDHKPLKGGEEAECNALIEFYNEPAWGCC